MAKRYEKHYKVKSDDLNDYESKPFSNDDQYEMRQIRQELDESRQEVKQLSEELRRLRSKESSMDAENQILKSKLLQADPNVKLTEQRYASNIPKLPAPSTGEGRSIEMTNYDEQPANYDYNNQYNYDQSQNYDQSYDYNQQQQQNYDTGINLHNADEQAINDIDQFLNEDEF